MTSPKTVWIAYLGVVLTAAFALLSLKERYHVEARNRAVELAIELETVEALAAAQNMTLADALQMLKAEGIGAAVLSEQKIGELIDDGFLQIGQGQTEGEVTLSGTADAIARVRRGYWVRFGSPNSPLPEGPTEAIQFQNRNPGLLRTVAVGLDPFFVSRARDAGLRIVARGDNPTGGDVETVHGTLRWFKEQGASVFLPQGDQVLGRRDNLEALVDGLEAEDLLYASPEFAKLGGDINVLGKVPERVVRLHSAQSAELDKMTFADAVDRYVRAGSERSMRLLLIRPLTSSSERPLDAYAEFVGKIHDKLEKEGLVTGPAKPFLKPAVPNWVFPAIGLAASIVAVCAATLLSLSPTFLSIVGIVAVGLGVGAWMPGVRGYTALMAAMAFPIAAFGFLEAHRHRIVAIHFLLMTAVCVVGGLAVAGLLNDLPYYIRAEQFEGVKLAHFGPILIVGLVMGARLVDWKEGLKSPITWLQALLAIVLLAALAFMFMRTGNDNPAGVSGVEMRLRSLLDNILIVRPRTKEFMIGYPALIVGLGLLMRIRAGVSGSASLRGWAVLALMVGAIALTSVVNTMCHLHTPLQVGLVRIAVGFVLGGIIGAGVWAVLRYGLPRIKAS